MTGLDTNVLVRYLAKDNPSQFKRACELIESFTLERPGFISLVTLVETVWVMEAHYDSSRADIDSVLSNLLSVGTLVIESATSVREALRLFSEGKADFADCLISRLGAAKGAFDTVTFDKKAARDAGMRYLQ